MSNPRWRILCVGKLKGDTLKDICEEYQKRLQRYGGVEIIEVADEKAPERLSGAQRKQVQHAEGERLRAQLRDGYTIALCIDGTRPDSLAFAKQMTSLRDAGKTPIQFLVGGSLGLDEALVRDADAKLSLSSLTFPHNLARLILLEQLFRAAKIDRGETYHK